MSTTIQQSTIDILLPYINQSIIQLKQYNNDRNYILQLFGISSNQIQLQLHSSNINNNNHNTVIYNDLLTNVYNNINNLSQLITILNIKQPIYNGYDNTINNIIHAIIDIRNNTFELTKKLYSLNIDNNTIQQHINNINQQLIQYNDIIYTLEHNHNNKQEQLTYAINTVMPTMQLKLNEYNNDIELYKQILDNNNYNQHITHNNIIEQYNIMKNLENECNILQNNINIYNNLPTDINMANIVVNEAEYKLKQLELQLANIIDKINVNG